MNNSNNIEQEQKTPEVEIKPLTNEEWRQVVDGRAEYIKGLVKDGQLFGRTLPMNDMNALVVAVYLEGVKQGCVNSELVLAQMLKERKEKEGK